MRATSRGWRWRQGISGLIAGLIVFAMLFTVGTGYFVLVSNVNSAYARDMSLRSTAMQNQIMEDLGVVAGSRSNQLTVTVTNDGERSANITDIMIIDPGGTLHGYGLGFPSNTSPSLPAPLTSEASTVFSSGLTIVSGEYLIKVITQLGSVFLATYPLTVSNPPIVGNALYLQMTASPPQVLSGATVTDTVSVSNYGLYAITGVDLQPTPPTASLTGTATLTGGSCSPASYASIAAYSGSGNPSSVTFTCTYTAHTGAVGGFASFSGLVEGTVNGVVIFSPEAVSNTIQIGGTVNVPTQGPFTVNAFFFGYSSCNEAPDSGRNGYYYPTACTTNPATMPPSSPSALPSGGLISAGTSYYIAYYVSVTNNFNATLPILDYSFMLQDPDNGYDSGIFLVTQPTNPQVPYYPDYNSGTDGLPTLTAYTATQTTCAESPPNYTPPSPTTCIDIAPGASVVLTFAACGFGATNWQWGGSKDDQSYDNSNGCSSVATGYTPPDGTYFSTVLCYIYKGQIFTQAIPFQGQIITP